eukprot:gene2027-2210_t
MTIAFIKADDTITNFSDIKIGSTPSSSPQDTTTLPQTIDVVFKASNEIEPTHIENSTSYDFIMKMESLHSLTDGWTVEMTKEMKAFSVKPLPISLRIVGVLGYYSKGKSFFINQLFNEIRGVEPKAASSPSFWRSWTVFILLAILIITLIVAAKTFSSNSSSITMQGKVSLTVSIFALIVALCWKIYSSDDPSLALRAQEAPGVTTKGISGIFASKASSFLNESSMLLLDTAGRNAPARGTSNKIESMHNNIFGLRSKESLIDDIISDVSDTIVYVMDEVLNEDQRTILHIIENIAVQKTQQKLVLVHNFKRINCHDHAVADTLLEQQVKHSFDASDKQQITGVNIMTSSWRFDLKDTAYDIEVYHAALFNQQYCAKENAKVVKELVSIFANNKRSLARDGQLFDIFAKSITKHLYKYVKLTPPSYSDKASGPSNALNDAKNTAPADEEVCVHDCFKLNSKNVGLELLPWERRAMPAPHSTGEFVPSYASNFIENGYKIRVDLPGMHEVKVANSTQSFSSLPTCDHNWVLVTIDNKDEQHRSVHVLGCRQRPEGDNSRVFGKFDVTFRVLYAYFNPQVALDNGELNIVWERVK